MTNEKMFLVFEGDGGGYVGAKRTLLLHFLLKRPRVSSRSHLPCTRRRGNG